MLFYFFNFTHDCVDHMRTAHLICQKGLSNKFTSSVVWNMYMHVYASIHCCLPPFQNISGFLHDGAMVYIHVSQMSCMVFPNRIKFRQ